MKLAPLDNAFASTGALGWIAAILFLVMLCAVIVLVAVLIQFLLVKIRAMQQASGPADGVPAAVSMSSSVAFRPDYRSAAVVPPENPHSGPTPTLNNPRARTRI